MIGKDVFMYGLLLLLVLNSASVKILEYFIATDF